MSDLDGVWAKMRRAEELIESVTGEIGDFFNVHSDKIVVRRDADRLADRYIWNMTDSPPDHVALLVGDALHNLRSSLDHLVWALSEQSGQTIANQVARQISFPILTNADKWDNVSANLQYVDPAAQAIIETLQPYNQTLRPLLPYGATVEISTDYDPLVVLHRWDIIDKHRTLHTMTVNALGGFPAVPVGGSFEVLTPETVEYGTEIARIIYKEPQVGPVSAVVNFPFDVTIREQPPTWGLSASVGHIRDVLRTDVFPQFEQFF
jgi:hypothetical protein